MGQARLLGVVCKFCGDQGDSFRVPCHVDPFRSGTKSVLRHPIVLRHPGVDEDAESSFKTAKIGA